MDFSAISEEIALEGLDGITLNALWTRLESRPNFVDDHLDEDSKHFIWKYISSVHDFIFYCLPEPRPELVIFEYSKCISNEHYNCILPLNTPPDIYSHKMIDKDGVKGCCDQFESRKNVTEEVRDSAGSCLISLDDVIKRWDQCFVIVASQRQRNLILMGSTICPVGVELYCTLEAVGRARYEGEISQCRYARGLSSPQLPKFDQKVNVFGRVKVLVSRGYLTKQPLTLKYQSPPTFTQVRLVHLPRFYRLTKANYRGGIQAINNYLLNKPNHTALYADVVKDLKLKVTFFKKRSRVLMKYFIMETVNYSALYPGAKDFKTKRGHERTVRIMRLIRPFNDDEYIDDDDEDDEDCDDDEDGEEGHKMDADVADDKFEYMDKESTKKISDPVYGYLTYDQSFLSQIVHTVAKSGERGLLHRELMDKLNLEKHVMRSSVKELLKAKAIASIKRAVKKNDAFFLVSPEVAERLKRIKRADDVKSQPSVDFSTVPEMQETLVLSEEPSLFPADEQITNSPIKELDVQVNNVTITLIMDRADPSTKPALRKEANDKKLARKKFILKELAQKKVFATTRSLYLEVCDKEKRQGMKELMCRKSFRRILKDLYDDGQIIYIRIYKKSKPDKMLQQMVLEPNISLEDCRVKEALHLSSPSFMRLECKGGGTDEGNKTMDLSAAEPAETSTSSEKSITTTNSSASKKPVSSSMVSVCQMLDKSVSLPTDEQSAVFKLKRKSKIPKFERARLLHKYLFYLLYGYEGRLDAPDQDSKEDCSESPPVYLDVDDWRRHLPPLKKHNEAFMTDDAMDGVCMIGDLLLHMPLSFFCRVFVSWEVDGLRDLLNDPVQRNYPITAVPYRIRSQLLIRRIYLAKLNESLLVLCHLGLLTFGMKTVNRELEFIIFYLHKKAVVLDTRKSNPGYNMTHCPDGETFEKLQYNFKCMTDVDNYWNDVKVIGLNSKLGYYSVDDVKGNHGTISLLDASQPTPLQEINEDDWLPGDHRGAGGFDSSLYIHRNTNWVPKTGKDKQKSTGLVFSSEIQKCRDIKGKYATELKARSAEEEHPTKKRKTSEVLRPSMPKALRASVKKSKQKKRIIRVIRKRPKLNVVDDIDRRAKLNMRRQRAYFSPLENGVLLLSQVASCILSPRTSFCVRSSLIRDILQELLPQEAKDKATSAVKGKMARLFKEPKFRSHLVTYITLVQSDKNLMEKYTSKKYTMHSPEMEKQFRQLHQDLWKKFSSPSQSPAMQLPGTLAELMDQYEVKNTLDILYKNPKVSKCILCEDDVKEMVVWELLESFLHVTKPLSGSDVYYTLSRFPEEVIQKAYAGLKANGIFIQMKKFEKDRNQIINQSAFLNNHKSTLRHRDAMKTRYPADLFWNMKGQMEALAELKQTELVSSVSEKIDNKTFIQGQLGQTKITSENSHNFENFMDTELQGPIQETGPSTSNTEQRNKVERKSSVHVDVQKNRDGDTHDKDDAEWVEESREETVYRELDLKKFHGGSVLTVLSLTAMDLLTMKLVIPDEMVKLDEEGKRKLYFKQPTIEQQRKRKHADSDDDSMETWLSPERNADSYQGQRSGQRHSTRETKILRLHQNAMDGNDHSSTPKQRPLSDISVTERSLKLKNITLKMRTLKSSASGLFEHFTVWVGSGSLLTLARTSLIDSLDLLNSKCLLQRNFIIEPLQMKFAVKGTAFHKAEAADSKKDLNPDCFAKKTNVSDTEAMIIGEETRSFNSEAPDSRKGLRTESEPEGNSKNGTSSEENSRLWFAEESYLNLIHHLEKCFSPEMNNDNIEQLLGKNFPYESQDEGRNLFKLIDSSGNFGITETDLETKLSQTICQIKPLLRHLIKADAVFKVGATQRRYVSRRHAKIWLVEVPVCSERHCSSQASDVNVQASHVKDAETRRSGSILYQCRLWRHFNGSLNWQGLQTVLQRVLTYLMTHPGCSLCRLCHVLNPDLLPATTIDAVDILEEIGCVDLHRVQKPAKPTLFSVRNRGLYLGDNITLEESVTVINVTIDAPIKLAYFLALAIEHSKKNNAAHTTSVETEHTTSVAEHTTFAVEHTTSAAEHTTSAAEHTTFAGEHTTSVETEHTTSVAKHTASAVEHTTSAAEHTAPAAEHTTFAEHTTCVETEHTTSAAEHTTFAEHTACVETEHTTSAVEHTTSAAEHTTFAEHTACVETEHTASVQTETIRPRE